jgi:drug/metabolite transporter (DMT)-like permease
MSERHPTISQQNPLTQTSAWTIYGKLVLTMVLWGIAWPVGRLLVAGLPPISIAVIRYAIVVPVFLVLLWLREHSFNLPRHWIPTFIFLGVLNTALYQAFFLFGVRYAAASDDSLVIGVGPVLIAIMASLVISEPLTRLKIAGLLSGLAGVGIIALLSPNLNVPDRILGISLVLGGALSYAMYTVFLRKFINQHPTTTERTRPSSLALITWISLFGWIFLIPLSLLEQPWTYAWDIPSWIGILYLALLSTVIGYLFYVEGVQQIGASRSAIFGNLVPVFGVLSSALILNEKVNIWHAASFALIFLGVLLVNRQPRLEP